MNSVMNSPMIISVEGNIGAGKTTFLENIEKILCKEGNTKIRILREPVDIWNTIKDKDDGETILSKFYKDPTKYSFAFQVMAFSTRLSELKRMFTEYPDCEILICERSLEADGYIFAKMLYEGGLMDDVFYQIYQKIYQDSIHEYSLDGIIYLDISPNVCAERILKRSRDGEGGITLDYLQKCAKYHDDWFSETDLKYKVNRMNETDIESFLTGGENIESFILEKCTSSAV